MKKITTLLSIIAFISFQAIGQVSSDSALTKDEMMEKSKKQKKTGFILIGGGLAMTIAGGAVYGDDFSNGAAPPMIAIGVGSMIGGLVMLIVSSSTQDRAEELTLGITPIDLPKGTYVGPAGIPSLNLSIPLNGRK